MEPMTDRPERGYYDERPSGGGEILAAERAPGHVTAKLAHLEKALTLLAQSLDQHTATISPILDPNIEGVAGRIDDRPEPTRAVSPVADRILESVRRVETLVEVLQSTTARVDL